MRIYLLAVLTGIGIWTSVNAETTGNLADINQLHLHTDYTYDEVTQTIDLDTVLPENYQVTSVDWSFMVHTYDNAVGCYANCPDDYVVYTISGYDAEGSLLGTTGLEGVYLEHNTGGWSAPMIFSGTVDAPEDLLGLSTIEIIEGGQDMGFWGGSYGPMFHQQQLYVTYDIGLPEPVVTPEDIATQTEQIMDVLDTIIEPVQVADTPEVINNDIVQAEPEVTEEEVVEETVEEVEVAETESESTQEETKETETETVTSEGKSENPKPSNIVNNAFQTLQLVQNIEQNNAQLASGMGLVGDFDAYTSLQLVETVALQDNEDWYSEKDFYEDSEYTETIQLSDKLKLQETQFYYGRTYQFY